MSTAFKIPLCFFPWRPCPGAAMIRPRASSGLLGRGRPDLLSRGEASKMEPRREHNGQT